MTDMKVQPAVEFVGNFDKIPNSEKGTYIYVFYKKEKMNAIEKSR
jgi:hypothetical protein